MPDVQAPSVPANLQVVNPTTNTVPPQSTDRARLVFDPSTDDSGAVAGYRVYRDGVLLPGATPTLNAAGRLVYVDNRLTTGQTYRYAVDAVDAAGNVSARAQEVPVTIALDTEAPAAPGDLAAEVPDVHGADVVVSWTAATDNIGVTGYGVYRDGVRIGQVSATATSWSPAAHPSVRRHRSSTSEPASCP